MSITAKELAKKLGLSEAAISLALNDKPGVSTKTKKKVLEAARENGYDFSRLPSNESSSKEQGSIYLIIYKKNGAVVTDTPFFAQLSEGIDLECKRYNYFLNILYIYEGEDIAAHLTTLEQVGAKGIILLGTEMQHIDMLPFSKCTIPFVILDNYFDQQNADCVLINNVQGAYTATDFLIKHTKSQPGYLHSSYPINNFDERADGFYKALRRNGMSTSRSVVHKLSPSIEGAYADMKQLLLQDEPVVSCYFADNDLIALGAMRAFQEQGYEIPKDISIIGFDNMPLCTYVQPPLTTIHVPKEYMGQMAVRRIHERITTSQNTFVKIEISTNLIKRKST